LNLYGFIKFQNLTANIYYIKDETIITFEPPKERVYNRIKRCTSIIKKLLSWKIKNKIESKNKEHKLGIVAGFTIDNHNDEYFRKCREWLKDGLIKGIKLYCGYEYYYQYDKRYQKIYDICIEYKVPVMIHTEDTFSSTSKVRFAHPLNIDDIAIDNPELTVIMCHLGNPWLLDCQEILYKNKNVYADISGLVNGNFTLYDQRYYTYKIKDGFEYVLTLLWQ
jgi:uncharacterized protein